MRRGTVIPWLAVPALLVLAASCRRPGGDQAAIEKDLEDKGTIELMEQVAEAEYEPPADGKLSEDQVRMYVEVKRREHEIVEVAREKLEEKSQAAEQQKERGREIGFFDAMRALGDVADIGTADLRAAQELGHNPAEYQWVKERILEVQMAEMTRGIEEMASSFQEQAIAMLEAQRAATADEAERRQIDHQIAELRQESAAGEEGDEPSAALLHNAELVSRYEDQIEAAQSDLERAMTGRAPAAAGSPPS